MEVRWKAEQKKISSVKTQVLEESSVNCQGRGCSRQGQKKGSLRHHQPPLLAPRKAIVSPRRMCEGGDVEGRGNTHRRHLPLGKKRQNLMPGNSAC